MPRVLVVEDYPPLATVVAIGVGRLGHEVVRVGSAQRARDADGHFDCAIIDIDLPDGSGVELAEELIDDRCVQNVIFYTATRDQALRLRALAVGPVVDKSEPLQILLGVLKERLTEPVELARVVGERDPTPSPTRGRSGTRPRVR